MVPSVDTYGEGGSSDLPHLSGEGVVSTAETGSDSVFFTGLPPSS